MNRVVHFVNKFVEVECYIFPSFFATTFDFYSVIDILSLL